MDNSKELYKKIKIANNQKTVFYEAVSRVMDVIISIFALIIVSPLIVIISVFIKLDDSKGNVFFSQTRIGKNGKEFELYKFRSMYADAEKRLSELEHLNEVEGLMFKMQDDPRITRVGRFLRKSSIDELPQLINVLKGEMSLVGPRPALPREVNEYTEYDKQRLYVAQGITGLWQVSGRSALTFDEMVELDLEFIEKRSITFYIQILLRTINVVFKLENAY